MDNEPLALCKPLIILVTAIASRSGVTSGAKRAYSLSEKWVRSFPMIWIKGTDEFTVGNDFSVSLMHNDPSDPAPLILIQIIPKERTL